MNFEQFTSKLKASAEAAATAARNFPGLDEMAAKDDYIHSENLNVRNKNTRQPHDKNSRRSTNTAQRRPIEPERPVPSKPPSSSTSRQQKSTHRSESSLSQNDSIALPLLSVVANALSSNGVTDSAITTTTTATTTTININNHESTSSSAAASVSSSRVATKSSSKATSERSYVDVERGSDHASAASSCSVSLVGSDEDSDDERDPILALLRHNQHSAEGRGGGAKRTAPLASSYHKHALEMEVNNGNESDASIASDQQRKKGQHRFLVDLEDRLSKPVAVSDNTPLSNDLQEEEVTPPLPSASVTASSWITGVLSTVRQSQMSNNAAEQQRSSRNAPLARRKPQQPVLEMEPDDDYDNVVQVSSSAMLAEDELRALQQFKDSSSSSNSTYYPVALFITLLREHPRESFLLLTLVLCIFAYFLSRRFAIEDNVK